MSEAVTHTRSIADRLRSSPWVAPLAVLAGGFLGSAVRIIVVAATPDSPGRFPTGTLAVNLFGSLILGFYLARRERAVSGRWSLQFWAIGALGSFTTFSAFSLEVVQLLDVGRATIAAGYVLASTLGGLAAAVLGHRLGSAGR